MTQMLMPVELAHAPALVRRNAGTGTDTHATTDRAAVSTWLAKQDVLVTQQNYRTQAERLLMWCDDQNLGLQDLTVDAMQKFLEFLVCPTPAEQWCLQPEPRKLPDGQPNPRWCKVQRVARKLPDGSDNPAWRPFVEFGLSPASVKQSKTILFGLMEFLCAITWLANNPMRALKKREPKPRADIERYLPHTAWVGLLEQIEALPQETPRQLAHYFRARFAIRFLVLTGLRRQELCSLRTTNLVSQWDAKWVKVLGKGDKEGLVPLPDDAINEIKVYRESLGLSPWPAQDEDSPLLRDIWGKRAVGVSALHELVTELCRASADPRVQNATSHWFRHTSASFQLSAGIELRNVQSNLRHANISTTSNYLHGERDRQHQDSQKLKLPGST